MMILQSLRLLRLGYNIQILSTRPAAFASSKLVQYQLEKTLEAEFELAPSHLSPNKSGRVQVHPNDSFKVHSSHSDSNPEHPSPKDGECDQVQMSSADNEKSARAPGKVQVHQCDLYNSDEDVTKALETLKQEIKDGVLCIMIDEVAFNTK